MRCITHLDKRSRILSDRNGIISLARGKRSGLRCCCPSTAAVRKRYCFNSGVLSLQSSCVWTCRKVCLRKHENANYIQYVLMRCFSTSPCVADHMVVLLRLDETSLPRPSEALVSVNEGSYRKEGVPLLESFSPSGRYYTWH